jgi:hypothetical protein
MRKKLPISFLRLYTESEYPAACFSKRGRKAIIDLCKEIYFYYGKGEKEEI